MLLFSEGNNNAHIIIIIIYLLMLPRFAWSHRNVAHEPPKQRATKSTMKISLNVVAKWKWSQAAVGFMVYSARSWIHYTTTYEMSHFFFFGRVFFSISLSIFFFSLLCVQYILRFVNKHVEYCVWVQTFSWKWRSFERKLRLDNPNDDVRIARESKRDKNTSKVVKYTHESLWKLKIWFQLRLNCILCVVVMYIYIHIHITNTCTVHIKQRAYNLVPYVKWTNRPK